MENMNEDRHLVYEEKIRKILDKSRLDLPEKIFVLESLYSQYLFKDGYNARKREEAKGEKK